MAEILVLDVCARRLSAAGNCFCGVCVSPRPNFHLFPLFCALFFPLFATVFAPAAFLVPSQGLVL
jgi:hypothetical protein